MVAHLAVLPKDLLLHTEVQLLRLPHPRTGLLCLFLPSGGSILEVQSISPDHGRSWFLDNNRVVSDGKLLLMTPVDPTFLLIPILQSTQLVNGSSTQFRPAFDIFENAASALSIPSDDADDPPRPNQDIQTLSELPVIQAALRRICEYKELSDDLTVFRFSQSKLMEMLQRKVKRLSEPAVFECSPILCRGLAKDGLMDVDVHPPAPESCKPLPSADDLVLPAEPMIEDPPEAKPKGSPLVQNLRQAGREKACINLLSQYLSHELTTELTELYDFSELDVYLERLAAESFAAAAAAAPRKGKGNALKAESSESDAAIGKKRKATSQASKGVEKLKKVNTTGMAKISSFFGKPK